MRGTRRGRSLLVVGAVAIAATAGCSSGDGADPDVAGGTGPATTSTVAGRAPQEIARPAVEGNGVVLPQPASALPEGYLQEEFFVGGTATRFAALDTPDDGFWTVEPAGEAPYRTRVIVRRPADPARFSGTVVVEWFNVSAIEAAPDWGYLSGEIGREGHAYVGVSAQSQGVEGGRTILDVQVDEQAAQEVGGAPTGSGLKSTDPQRYGPLAHPGDAYSFDIFSQVGRALHSEPGALLGDLQPTQVLAVGESQSAIFLSTLVNALHPLDPVFDGFLIHSRGANVAPLDGDFLRARSGQDVSAALQQAVRLRTDLDEPVFLFETETDLTLLGYARARQPDTDRIRTWEVAGTSHADAHVLRSIIGGPRDPGVGSLLGCPQLINTGPQHEVVQAALHHLVAWVAGGEPPPTAERIELTPGDEQIARAADGIALGGVRNPLVDVPVATLTGDPPGGATLADLASGSGGVCLLFGQTIPFDRATLVERYGTADRYVEAFRASADRTVAAGFLLRPDADQLIAEADADRVLFD
ncbi:alpha/beta hydrolase domain-containing protein [Rhabdothermincola sp.]|uniref:alpha/beta hydrolase domain-containing protein n=1 Tax=Rhabdothermincola sp. TaxID=2820405 RepID=UPI002FE2EA4A